MDTEKSMDGQLLGAKECPQDAGSGDWIDARFDVGDTLARFFRGIGLRGDRDRFIVKDQGRGVVGAVVVIEIAKVEAATCEEVFHRIKVTLDFAEIIALREKDEKIFVVADCLTRGALVVFIALD